MADQDAQQKTTERRGLDANAFLAGLIVGVLIGVLSPPVVMWMMGVTVEIASHG